MANYKGWFKVFEIQGGRTGEFYRETGLRFALQKVIIKQLASEIGYRLFNFVRGDLSDVLNSELRGTLRTGLELYITTKWY